jgi:hypothetical protein
MSASATSGSTVSGSLIELVRTRKSPSSNSTLSALTSPFPEAPSASRGKTFGRSVRTAGPDAEKATVASALPE